MGRVLQLVAALCGLVGVGPPGAAAISVHGYVLDAPDSVPGEDRWRALYFVTDWSGYAAGYGFTIRIPLADPRYIAVDTPQGGGDWQVEVLVRDALVPADGAFDARASNASPGLAQPFSVEFVWADGAGVPPLPNVVDVYDDGFSVIETTLVPEPAVAPTLLAGLLALLALQRRRARRSISRASLALFVLAAAALPPSAASALDEVGHDVVVGDYTMTFVLKIDQAQRITQTTFDYPVEATVVNTGSDPRAFAIHASASSPTLAVVGGSLVFPGLGLLEGALADGLVVRLDRRAEFDPNELQWTLQHAGDFTCSLDSDCASNHCSNGYCCPSGDCCGMDSDCDAYDVAASCDDATSCQGTRTDGVCNGLSQCEAVAGDDDSGCLGEQAASCVPYAPVFCSALPEQGPPVCAGSCASDADCASAHHCELSACVPDLPTGAACGQANECASGACTDGFCCDTACAGTCQACDLPGLEGTCTPIPNGQDPDLECGSISCAGFYWGWSGDGCYRRQDAPASAVACDGASACQSAATLCGSTAQGALTLMCDSYCQDPTGGTCTGQIPGVCTNVSQGDVTCGTGPCQVTQPACSNGTPQVCTPNWGASSPEACNDVDDDCDGTVDDGAFADAFEPNGACASPANLVTVGSHQTRTYTTQTIYGSGDNDYYLFTATETDSTCSCCDFFCTDEDYQLKLTLGVPPGAGSYAFCVGASCGSIGASCQTVTAGTSATWTVTLDGACGVGTDSYPYYVRIYGQGAPAFECAPYSLSYQFIPGCF